MYIYLFYVVIVYPSCLGLGNCSVLWAGFICIVPMLLLSMFWTSCDYRCCPFSPPIRAFVFIVEGGSAFPLVVDCCLDCGCVHV